MKQSQRIAIYQAKSGAIELREDIHAETVWATQAQIADIFNIDRSVATKHIQNIFKNKEIEIKGNVQKMHIAHSDKPVAFYSLDIILAVGYRANSGRAMIFRRWATKTLRQHILQGYTLNRKRLVANYAEFLKAVDEVKQLLPERNRVSTQSVLELVKMFASTWFSLHAFDTSAFPQSGSTKKRVTITANELTAALLDLKKELATRRETSELFASERTPQSITNIVRNVY